MASAAQIEQTNRWRSWVRRSRRLPTKRRRARRFRYRWAVSAAAAFQSLAPNPRSTETLLPWHLVLKYKRDCGATTPPVLKFPGSVGGGSEALAFRPCLTMHQQPTHWG
jgi:hypothetical protein